MCLVVKKNDLNKIGLKFSFQFLLCKKKKNNLLRLMIEDFNVEAETDDETFKGFESLSI
jgi:hypothetical protein